MTAAPAPLGLAETFALILDGLCRAAAARMAADRASIPLLMLAWRRLRRLVARFASLAARVRAGTLKPPRRRTTPRPAAATRKPDVLPRDFAWLLRLVPGPGAGCAGSQLQHLLSQPEMIALIAAAPQAGRLLRPLCRALAVALPPSLQLPRRPARPKPVRPKPPSAEAPEFKPTRTGPLRRRPRGPAPPGTVWRRWRGIWMPEPLRPAKPA